MAFLLMEFMMNIHSWFLIFEGFLGGWHAASFNRRYKEERIQINLVLSLAQVHDLVDHYNGAETTPAIFTRSILGIKVPHPNKSGFPSREARIFIISTSIRHKPAGDPMPLARSLCERSSLSTVKIPEPVDNRCLDVRPIDLSSPPSTTLAWERCLGGH